MTMSSGSGSTDCCRDSAWFEELLGLAIGEDDSFDSLIVTISALLMLLYPVFYDCCIS